jgi:serine/threonine protein kinase
LWYRCPEILLGCDTYSTTVDIWAAGCIFAEMANGPALFQGDSEIDQLYRIFQKLGTPLRSTWPGVAELPEYTDAFPKFRRLVREKSAEPVVCFERVRLVVACWSPLHLCPSCLQPMERIAPKLDAAGLDLLSRMLEYDPTLRISAADALRHPYFEGAVSPSLDSSGHAAPGIITAAAPLVDRGQQFPSVAAAAGGSLSSASIARYGSSAAACPGSLPPHSWGGATATVPIAGDSAME